MTARGSGARSTGTHDAPRTGDCEDHNVLNLDFTEEQEMLRRTVRGLLTSSCPISTVRELEDDPIGYSPLVWKQLAELDLIGLLLPEAYGGSEMTALEGVVVYEELGRSMAPVPHFVSAVLCGSVLAKAGSEEQRSEWLPKIVSGDAVLTPAWLEPESGFGPAGVQMRAVPDGDGFRLTGTKRHVSFARAATRLLVLARTGPLPEDVDLFLVAPDSAGIRLSQKFSIASDAQYDVQFDQVLVDSADRVGPASSGWSTWQEVMKDGCILLAAQAMGGAHAALDMTVQYAKDRHQFDKPLGAFQAIAHGLSDAVTTVDGGDTLVYQAAWARSVNRPTDRIAPMAKLFACRTYRDVTALAQQDFGGIGFTLEVDVQMHFRRAKQLQLSWWDSRYLEELVASAVLDPLS
jgi:alkylation response protein AidB-like acyl-CoA dehydrogenase